MNEVTTDNSEARQAAARSVAGPLLLTLGLAALLVVGVTAVNWRAGILILAGTALAVAGSVIMGRNSRS